MIAEEGGGWNDDDWSEFHRFVAGVLLCISRKVCLLVTYGENFKRSQLVAGLLVMTLRRFVTSIWSISTNLLTAVKKSSLTPIVMSNRHSPTCLPNGRIERLYRQLRDVGVAFKVYPNKWMNGTKAGAYRC